MNERVSHCKRGNLGHSIHFSAVCYSQKDSHQHQKHSEFREFTHINVRKDQLFKLLLRLWATTAISNGESNRRKIVQLKEKAKLNKCVNGKPTMNSSRSRTQSDLADILKMSQGTLPQKTHF